MTRKTKLILFLLFGALLGLASFFIFRLKARAPHTISIQNHNNDVADMADSPLVNGLIATNTATNSDIENQPENATNDNPKKEEPAKPIKSAEIKKEAANDNTKITQKLVSWGFSSTSNRKIDTIIIHSSYNALGGNEYSVEKLIAEYKEYGVAPHYLIDRAGKIYQLVSDKNIAYHAGESKVPDGRTQVNSFSIGIEMINTKTDNYTDKQYTALKWLLSNLKAKYSIKYTLGHDDISPGRKTDPWNFDWGKIK